MPAKPRRRVDVRRVEEARRARLAAAGFRVLEPLARDFAGRDLLAVDRLRDLFDVDRCDLVSPFSLRILFTVLAATSSARPPYRPDFLALSLMWSYCRSRFGLAPSGI